MFDVIFRKIDKWICLYLGLGKCDIEKPKSIKFSKNKLTFCKNHAFQRHCYQERLDFSECAIIYHPELNRKIGVAAGNAIARDLIISFEKVEIKKCL